MSNTVENQRRVLVHRDMPKEKEGNFLLIKNENLFAAFRELNATALCLYLYLAGNKDGFDLAFSPKAIHNEMGLPESTCRDQFKVLVNKGYLVRRSETSNRYDFYEIPKEKETAVTASAF